jgi:hypothetical protein
MISWIKNLYKGDNSLSIPVTIVSVFVAYWFLHTSYSYSPAHALIFSKGVYDKIISIGIVFIIFRVIFVKTSAIQKWIKYKNDFLWALTYIAWGISIIFVWVYIDFDVPKFTTNIIYKTTDLPKYVIDPCSYWKDPQEPENSYTKWTKEQEKQTEDFWNEGSFYFHSKCTVHEYDSDY